MSRLSFFTCRYRTEIRPTAAISTREKLKAAPRRTAAQARAFEDADAKLVRVGAGQKLDADRNAYRRAQEEWQSFGQSSERRRLRTE
jgi:hypothetical protein